MEVFNKPMITKMDYLPYIDDDLEDSEFEPLVGKLLQEELRKQLPEETVSLHPEVTQLLNGVSIGQFRFDKDLYENYKNFNDQNIDSLKRKRPSDDDMILREYKTKYPRIDISRYTLINQEDTTVLAIMDSYLRYQLLSLERLLPRTLLNQWAINNDFLATSDKVLDSIIETQENQIRDLNQYRKTIQLQNQPIFDQYAQQWRNKLINNINV